MEGVEVVVVGEISGRRVVLWAEYWATTTAVWAPAYDEAAHADFRLMHLACEYSSCISLSRMNHYQTCTDSFRGLVDKPILPLNSDPFYCFPVLEFPVPLLLTLSPAGCSHFSSSSCSNVIMFHYCGLSFSSYRTHHATPYFTPSHLWIYIHRTIQYAVFYRSMYQYQCANHHWDILYFQMRLLIIQRIASLHL